MQFADVLCYMILMITVAVSCAAAEEQKSELEESQSGIRISKREATVLLDNYPVDRIFQKPKVIYRRISKQRYGPPKSKYGPPKSKYGPPKSKYGPPRPKYRPSKPTRKPIKKAHKAKPKPLSSKYGPPDNLKKQRAPKPKTKYGPPKSRPGRPGIGHIIKMPHYSFFVPDKLSFGEPPMQYLNEYPQKQSYGEPPVDSYGAPLKSSIKDVYPTPQSVQDTSENYDTHDFNRQEYQSWDHNNRHTQNLDTNYAFTKKQPMYAEQNKPVYVTPTPKDYNEEEPLDPDESKKHILQDNKFFFRKKRPFYFADSKVVNRPWTLNKHGGIDDDIIVGGQYAEPPARYVAKFPPNSPMYADDEDEDTFNPLHGYVDTDVALSANNSPYSNYKNSNMAFSPQNLNDAFSIVDRK